MDRMAGALARLVLRIGDLAALVALPLLIAISTYDIVGRQFFNTGSTRLQELEWHLFFGLVVLSLGATYLRDGHVRVDVLRQHWGEGTRGRVELAGIVLLMVPVALLFLYTGADMAWSAFTSGERSRAALGLPNRWIVKSTLPLGALLLLLAALAVGWRTVVRLRRRS